MNKYSRSRFIALGGAAASAALARPASAQLIPGTPYQRQIFIAVCAPLSGEKAELGAQLYNGARQAVYEANRTVSQLQAAFGVRSFDDRDSLVGGISAAEFAGDDPTVIATVGHLTESVTLAALPQYANAKMPLIVPASSADAITRRGYRNIFRLPTKDTTEGQLFAQYLQRSAPPKRAVALTQDGDYGPNVAQGFTAQLRVDRIAADTVVLGAVTPDFADAAKSILSSGADYVFLAGNTASLGPGLLALRAAGYKGTFGASQGFYNGDSVQKYSHELGNALVSTSMPPLQKVSAINMDLSDLRASVGEVTPLSAFGFASTQLAINAVRRTGAADRLSLLHALQNAGSYDTLVGSFSFSFTGDPVDPNLYFYSIADGRFKYAGSAHSSSFLI
ncbi:MAG: branched-chain amino acid ABC transporter substrate-binding protein [Candidatus Baltobacteraceae bacterium]